MEIWQSVVVHKSQSVLKLLRIIIRQNQIVQDDFRFCSVCNGCCCDTIPTMENLIGVNLKSTQIFTCASPQCCLSTLLSLKSDQTSGCTERRFSTEWTNPTIYPQITNGLRTHFVNAHLASCFVAELKNSPAYRSLAWAAWHAKIGSFLPTLEIRLIPPMKEYLDKRWCVKLQRLLYERLELEHLFSWLSTLGGAYSSLGDNYAPCAELAGKISLQQMKIGLRLGDPHLVARCYLFLALSFIQKLRLRKAAAVIKRVHQFGKTSALEDKRLINMCLGLWARLQYNWSQKRRMKVSKRN